MSKDNTREAKLKILFATHPDVDTFFMTADDKAFYERHQADAHAQKLKNQKVECCARKTVELQDKPAGGDTDILDDQGNLSEEEASNLAEAAEKLHKELSEDLETSEGSAESELSKAPASPEETSASEPDEREALMAAYAEKYGKKPAHNISIEKLKAALAAE